MAQAWHTLLQRFPDNQTLFVSPASAGNGESWFDAFFSACKSLYGASGCRIGALAVHDYTCDADSLMSYLSDMHQRYHLPIWMTEFACGDHSDHRSLADQLSFARALLPKLEAASFVARYAWMSARQSDPSDHRALLQTLANGTAVLTELGQLYNSL